MLVLTRVQLPEPASSQPVAADSLPRLAEPEDTLPRLTKPADSLPRLDPPFFSHSPGFYSEPIELSIYSRTPDEQVRRGESGNVRFNNVSVSGVSKNEPVFADSGSGRDNRAFPQQVRLMQNYPNPFNPQTLIEFEVPVASLVRLEVFDVLGRRVAVAVDGPLGAGRHTVRFDAGALRLSGGVYIYRLQAGGQTVSRTMMLVR